MKTTKETQKNIQNKNTKKNTNMKENRIYDTILLNEYYIIY